MITTINKIHLKMEGYTAYSLIEPTYEPINNKYTSYRLENIQVK